MLNTKLESVDTITQTSKDTTFTFTTHAQTATTALVVADGSGITDAETATILVSLQTQIDALVADVAALIAGT